MSSPDPSSGLMQGADTELLKESMEVLMTWKPESDVFALKNYMFASSLLSSGSAAFINAHYRKAVKLRNQAFVTTFIPVVVFPSIVGTLLHHHFVQRPLILQKFKCPVCLELRGGVMQVFSGLLYPLVLAPLSAFQFAVRLYTYHLPDIRDPKALLKEYFKMTKPILSKLYLLGALHVIAGIAWTHWEADNLFTVMSKLANMEEEVNQHLEEKSKLKRQDFI